MRLDSRSAALLTAALLLFGCDAEAAPECTSTLDCVSGSRCVDGRCEAAPDTGAPDGATMDASADSRAPDAAADTAVADTAVADTATADTAIADAAGDSSAPDTGPADTGGDTGAPECSPGDYRTCPGPGGQYCRPSGMWSACLTADPSCTGSGGSYTGCRGTGCSVCTDLLATYDCYFERHPGCVPNPTCGGMYFTCSPGCPAPTPADRCP